MSDDQFTKLSKQISDVSDGLLKLYQHTEKRFDEQDAISEARFNGIDRKIDHLYSVVDTILKNQETDQQERLAINAQLDRHERWHHQTADHFGLKLIYQAE